MKSTLKFAAVIDVDWCGSSPGVNQISLMQSCEVIWDLISIHQNYRQKLNIAEVLHSYLATSVGKLSSAHFIRDLLPAYLDDGLVLSGTYLETLISRSSQSGNFPYAWVGSITCHEEAGSCK